MHLYPRRRNVSAQVAEELKPVTYATPPMEEHRKKRKARSTTKGHARGKQSEFLPQVHILIHYLIHKGERVQDWDRESVRQSRNQRGREIQERVSESRGGRERM